MNEVDSERLLDVTRNEGGGSMTRCVHGQSARVRGREGSREREREREREIERVGVMDREECDWQGSQHYYMCMVFGVVW